jgi:UDP-glucose:(galactosyl)LPS alpha-1,2-glucosyltransferase
MMNILISSNLKWFHPSCVLMYSIFKHNPDAKVYYMSEGLDAECIERLKKIGNIEYINIADNFYNYISKQAYLYPIYSKETYCRLIAPYLINESRLIYIDADAVCINKLDELYNIDLDGNYVAGVVDTGIDHYKPMIGFSANDDYINTGVLLMDLDAIRRDSIHTQWLDIANTKQYQMQDQDAINISCNGKIKVISNKYNMSRCTSFEYSKLDVHIDEALIIHYAGHKPWNETNVPLHEYWDRYNNELMI